MRAERLIVADWNGTCFKPTTAEEENKRIAYAKLGEAKKGLKRGKVWKIWTVSRLLKAKKLLNKRLEEYKEGNRPLAEVYEPFNKYVIRGMPMGLIWDVLRGFAEDSKGLVDRDVLDPIQKARMGGHDTGILSVSTRYVIGQVLAKSGYGNAFNPDLVIANRIVPNKKELAGIGRVLGEPIDEIEEEVYRTVLESCDVRAEEITLNIYGKKGEVMEYAFFDERGYEPHNTFYIGDTEDDEPVADMLPSGHFIVPFLAEDSFRNDMANRYSAFVPEDRKDLEKYLLSA